MISSTLSSCRRVSSGPYEVMSAMMASSRRARSARGSGRSSPSMAMLKLSSIERRILVRSDWRSVSSSLMMRWRRRPRSPRRSERTGVAASTGGVGLSGRAAGSGRNSSVPPGRRPFWPC
jgi:hypothetical protein